jgi:ABC-2 type transport system permease protein
MFSIVISSTNKTILWALVRRNLLGKYKNSFLGFGWQFITPLVMIILYYVVFTELRMNNKEDYWVFISVAVLAFNYMQSNFAPSGSYIISNANYVKKNSFPRELLVLSNVVSTFIVYLISLAVLIVSLLIIGWSFSIESICTIVVVLILQLFFVYGISLAISSICVFIRDVQHLLNSITIAMFWITPIFYELATTTGLLRAIVMINPFTYFVECMRSGIYYGSFPELWLLLSATILAASTFAIGSILFDKLKSDFVELL